MLWDKTSSRPKGLSKQDNRTTVVTDRGFERNIISGTRVKREILVPLNGLTSTFPQPGITDVWNEPSEATVVVEKLSGTVATVAGSAVTGTGTKFQTELTVGQKVRIGANVYATVATITSNTAMTVSPNMAGVTSGNLLYKMTVQSVTTKISFAEPISADAASKIVINDVTNSGTINAVSPAPTAGANILAYTWTPTYPGNYTISAQSIANNTATAINIKSTNADSQAADVAISSGMATVAGTFVLRNA